MNIDQVVCNYPEYVLPIGDGQYGQQSFAGVRPLEQDETTIGGRPTGMDCGARTIKLQIEFIMA